MNDLNLSRISVGLHVVAGVTAGYLSDYLSNNWLSLTCGVLMLIATGYIAEMVTKKKDMKWWVSNGLILYLLVWFVTWVFLFNL